MRKGLLKPNVFGDATNHPSSASGYLTIYKELFSNKCLDGLAVVQNDLYGPVISVAKGRSMNRNYLGAPVVAALVVLASAAPGRVAADPVIVNGSFEAPARASNSITEITLTGVPGWTGNSIGGNAHEYIINGNITDLQGRNYGTTPFGSQYLGLNAVARRSFHSIESQSVAGFVAGASYALTVYFANLDGAKDATVSVVASDGATGSGFVIASKLFTAPQEGPYGLGVIDFLPAVLDFTALSTGSMTFSIGNSSLTGTLGVDNVSLATLAPGGVPEPTTWALLITGFGIVGGSQRLRRTRAASDAG